MTTDTMSRLSLKSAPAAGKWRDTALVIMLLVYSGNPAPGRIFPIDPQLIFLSLFCAFLLLRQIPRLMLSDFAGIALLYAVILLIQCVDFSFYPVVTIMGFFVRLFIGYAVIRLVVDFPNVYVQAMVVLAGLSLVIHIPYLILSQLSIDIEGSISRIATVMNTVSISRRPLLLHTFMGDFQPGNAGMFWEPGAFQGYLILALIFLTFLRQGLSKQHYRLYFVILSVTVLTTMSTTGYIAFALIPALHYYTWKVKRASRRPLRDLVVVYLISPFLLGGMLYVYSRVPFLRPKIESQLRQVEDQRGSWHLTRIGSIQFDWPYIKQRPLTGWGLHLSTRYALDPQLENLAGMGNGMSDFTARFGITGMLIWLFCVFRRIMHLTERSLPISLLVMLIISLILQGECFLNFPLFLGLMFFCPLQSSQFLSKT